MCGTLPQQAHLTRLGRNGFMRAGRLLLIGCGLIVLGAPVAAQRGGAPADTTPDPIKELIARLDLEKYKATIKGLTQFGDRRQGTDRNRAAVDWIEAQLKSYGCANVERITYTYTPPPPRDTTGGRGRGGRAGND